MQRFEQRDACQQHRERGKRVKHDKGRVSGERPEPAFLISKPYSEEQVRSAVSQAMFFASSEGMTVA